MTDYIPANQSIYIVLGFYILFIMTGMPFSDTLLDGPILDDVPNNRLARKKSFFHSSKI